MIEGLADGRDADGFSLGVIEGDVEEGVADGTFVGWPDGDTEGKDAVGDTVGDVVSWQNPVSVASRSTSISLSGMYVSYREQDAYVSMYTYTEQEALYLPQKNVKWLTKL